jgi:hypothetical protein
MDLGALTQLRVRHDGQGLGAKWQLARMAVRNFDTGQEWEFPCGDDTWVKQKEWTQFTPKVLILIVQYSEYTDCFTYSITSDHLHTISQ